MIQITPQMRILVAVEPADFRKGIDGLARVCKDVLRHDPFGGCVFVFRNRPATALTRIIHGLRNKTASTAFKKLPDKDFIQRTEASREYTVCFAV